MNFYKKYMLFSLIIFSGINYTTCEQKSSFYTQRIISELKIGLKKIVELGTMIGAGKLSNMLLGLYCDTYFKTSFKYLKEPDSTYAFWFSFFTKTIMIKSAHELLKHFIDKERNENELLSTMDFFAFSMGCCL